jgi:hypothetical protein
MEVPRAMGRELTLLTQVPPCDEVPAFMPVDVVDRADIRMI